MGRWVILLKGVSLIPRYLRVAGTGTSVRRPYDSAWDGNEPPWRWGGPPWECAVEFVVGVEPRLWKVVHAEMNPIQPRFEFRVWADRLDAVESRIRALSECHRIRESTETYIVSSGAVDVNPKVREGQLDIKVLIATREGFEQWEPRLKATFPVPAALLRDELFPLLGQPPPALEPGTFSVDQFLDDIVARYDGLAAVEVTKRRRAFTVSGCITEFADVSIGGTELQTAAVESADIGALRDARRLTGLDAFDNVNYPAAIKAAIGWVAP